MPKFFLLLLLPFAGFAQGPLDGYMKGKGNIDLAPSISFNNAKKFEGAGGQIYDEPYNGQALSLFAAYGLSKSIDLVGTATAVFTPTQSGLQDGGLFLKYRPFYKEMKKWGKLGILFGSGATFPISDYEPTSTGALGQKAVTLPFKAIAQWETPTGVFLNFTGGYHLRLDQLAASDIAEIRQVRPDYEPIQPQHFTTYLLKIGFPAKHYYLDAWAEWQHTRDGNDYTPNVPDLAQAFAVSYTQIGGTAFYSDSGKTGFYISSGIILKGRNTSRINRVTLGVVIKW